MLKINKIVIKLWVGDDDLEQNTNCHLKNDKDSVENENKEEL